MLTIIKNPSKYNFSKSPVMCEIETDNMLTSGDFGDKAKFVVYVPGNPVNGNNIIFLLANSYTYTVSFGTGPGGLVALRGVGESDTDWYNRVMFAFSFGMSGDFNITYIGSGGFQFEAKVPGPDYSNSGSSVSGTGFSFVTLLDGTTNVLTNVPRPNYKIEAELVMETKFRNEQWEIVTSALKEPINNKIVVDFSTAINSKLDYDFPAPNQSISFLCENVMKRFFITIREYFGSPPVASTSLVISPYGELQEDSTSTFIGLALKAGLAPRWNKNLPNLQLESYIWSYPLYLTTKQFPIKIKRHQPEYLFFPLPHSVDSEDTSLKIITVYNNGTANSVSYQYTYVGNSSQGAVICFPLNNSSSIIDTVLATKNTTVEKFTVSIVSLSYPDINLSPAVDYYPDFEPSNDEKVFLFTNSMGGVDTWRSFSSYEEDVEFEKEVGERVYRTDDPYHLGMNTETQHEKSDVFTVFSGWKTKEELDWLEDIFLAKYRVEVIDALTYMPIIITSKKYRKHKTNSNLRGIEIEYYHALKSKVTSRLAAAI